MHHHANSVCSVLTLKMESKHADDLRSHGSVHGIIISDICFGLEPFSASYSQYNDGKTEPLMDAPFLTAPDALTNKSSSINHFMFVAGCQI